MAEGSWGGSPRARLRVGHNIGVTTATSDGLTKGDRTRASLIGAAIARFAREGFRGTSVADICRDAGLSTTASYPYFANKEALFVAAVDEDVAGLIDDAVHLVGIQSDRHWGHTMMVNLMARLDFHPLAKRVVSGLEPEFTIRLLDIPALEQLRKGVAELMRQLQVVGEVRRDVEPDQMASGLVVIVISLLTTAVQTGPGGLERVADDIEAVLDAATRPVA
jgi:AcrR family transcriptional regulator